MKRRSFIIIIIVLVFTFIGVLRIGFIIGEDSGARQMARHILHPNYKTTTFEELVIEECSAERIDPNRVK